MALAKLREKGRKVGISIAGGGARLGWLAGAVSGLLYDEQLRKNVRVIYGSSAGAVAGAKAALAVVRNSLEPLEDLAQVIRKLTPLSFAGLGSMTLLDVVAGALTGFEDDVKPQWGILELIRENMSVEDWRALVRAGDRVRAPFEFGICVTRQHTLESEIVTTRGCRESRILAKALAASASIPGLLPAVEVFPGVQCVDGCVVDLNPAAFLSESELARDLDGVIVLGTSVVENVHAPIKEPVSSVGERVGHVLGLLEKRRASTLPVVRIGPPEPIPGGPLDFNPAHMMQLWHHAFRYGMALVGANYPR